MTSSLRATVFCTTAALALAGGLSLASAPAFACGGEGAILGEVCTVTGTDPENGCPLGTLPADGRWLPIKDNQALFSVLGTKFGGDGKHTFALPNAGKDQGGITPKDGEIVCVVIQGIHPAEQK